jgi:hypothetical protein
MILSTEIYDAAKKYSAIAILLNEFRFITIV